MSLLSRPQDIRELKMLGEGGFGKALLVEDASNGAQYVLKIIKPTRDSEAAFEQEVAGLMESSEMCRHIPMYYGGGTLNYEGSEVYAILMEFVSGDSLDKVYKNMGGNISSEMGYFIMRGLLTAVSCLHCKGMVHRDIKLENAVIMANNGESSLKLIDLGLSCFLKGNTLTRMQCKYDSVSGTVLYMSPELGHLYVQQQKGRNSQLTPEELMASDIWACGIMFYELMTGEFPYGNKDYNSEDYLYALNDIYENNTQIVTAANPTIFEKIVLQCLRPKASSRPSAKELLTELVSGYEAK